MSDSHSNENLQFNAKVAGWLYFTIIVTTILSLIFLAGQFTDFSDNTATIAKIAKNPLVVRGYAVFEIFMYSAVIILAASLFELLKPVNPLLARSAMLLRVGEAMMGYISVICLLAILFIAKDQKIAADMQSQALVIYSIKDIASKILMFCISIGSIFFCWLFYKSRMIPRFLSIWGIVGFSLMLLAGTLVLLDVGVGKHVNALAAGLVILFEIAIGLWLMVKGVNTTQIA